MNSKRKKTEDDDEITRKRNERKERRERLLILSKKKIADELDKKRNAEKLAKKRKAEKRKSKKNDDSPPTPKTSRKLVFDGSEEKNDDVHENKENKENKEVEENKEEGENKEVEENKEEEVEVEGNKEVEENKEEGENKEVEKNKEVEENKDKEKEAEVEKEKEVEKEAEKNDKEEDLPHVPKEKKEEKKSKQLGEYTDPGGKGFKLNDPVKVNPLLRIDEEKMKELKKWLKSDAKDFKELTTCSADRSLFNRLLKPQQWLHNTEIDEICHLLKRRAEEFPKTYPRNFSIADSNLSQKMSNRYEVFTPNPAGYKFDDLMEYVIGEGSNPWNIVDMIYVPLNIKQKHWVLCKIHLQDWCIYVYDCEQNMFPKDEYDTFLEPMCVMVPYLLEQGFSTSDKQRFPQIKLDAMPYSIIPHPIVPKTTKSGDCGVFTIMHLEYLTASLDISNVVTENMNFWRNKWAVRLFHQIVDP
ncbi:DNA ligase 1-like [Impatiens glandulifera]|uniref:DNA ligase 1-like n=1 Tax=Impatiens glandulifera TaxID=253017 RepID=UPI001FB13317|nr:DNA ligase 1-like [Impatiens glandulifera]